MIAQIQESLQRIYVIFLLTYREAIRRRLLIVFLAGCLIIIGLGGGCNAVCAAQDESQVEEMEERRQYAEQILANPDLPEEQREYYEYMRDSASQVDVDEIRKQRAAGLIAICFFAFTFWLYMLATFFTPFIAMNDFYTGSHVLTLASPVKRWEYIMGKYLGVYSMLIVSAVAMLIPFHPLIRASADDWGWDIYPGLAILFQGLAIYVAMILFLALSLGRILSMIVSILVAVLTGLPNYLVLIDAEIPWEGVDIAVQAVTFALPQLTSNFLHGFALLAEMSGNENLTQQIEGIGLMEVFKIGNHLEWYIFGINMAWLVALLGGSLTIFQRREITN